MDPSGSARKERQAPGGRTTGDLFGGYLDPVHERPRTGRSKRFVPAAGADRQFDIFGNPIAPRPATAAASTPAPRGAAAPPRGPGAAAGAPSAHESARSPDTRFATVQARASADGRRLFGHHAPGSEPPPA
ncbi:hypothetical protein FNF29_00690 [Cafeteria roenbergensis]|uniref:Uncharacterized protein n=1 Tax=Cafeteria roenbergensis TaxID=33653 RepID=A0A5A8CV34_CAFRO|nr:hypothetical protein FNF29_00690 [Cafeteria roenbergensis]|eukprot:KAA0156579.1 hypothetical protein FNF29_00690 [Cafeteria roenbergensis]